MTKTISWYTITYRFQERYSVKGNKMNKKESFENAIKDAQTAVSLKEATQRVRIDVRAELARCRCEAFMGTDFENQ